MGEWIFPTGNEELNAMWNSISFLPNILIRDSYVWNGNASGQCTISSVWKNFRISSDKVDGDGLLWHTWHIPRFSFILWLASRGRLRTLDRLHNNSQRTCLLCNVHEETHCHLFFECTYSISIWQEIKARAQMVWTPAPWPQAWAETVHRYCNKSNPRHKLVGLALASTVYHLWRERNSRAFNSHFSNAQQTQEAIIQSMRERLGGINEGIRPPE
ncbi:hypothetical protein OIU84_023944, partial [Salix udensis]